MRITEFFKRKRAVWAAREASNSTCDQEELKQLMCWSEKISPMMNDIYGFFQKCSKLIRREGYCCAMSALSPGQNARGISCITRICLGDIYPKHPGEPCRNLDLFDLTAQNHLSCSITPGSEEVNFTLYLRTQKPINWTEPVNEVTMAKIESAAVRLLEKVIE